MKRRDTLRHLNDRHLKNMAKIDEIGLQLSQMDLVDQCDDILHMDRE